MLRARIHELRPGMTLARSLVVPHVQAAPILDVDERLTATTITKLRKLGVVEVWVRWGSLDFLDELISEKLHLRQCELFAQICESFFRYANRAEAEIDLPAAEDAVRALFEYLQNDSGNCILLDRLLSFDPYLLGHSANVCYLSLLLGLKLEWYLRQEMATQYSRSVVLDLGIGALYHDVGKLLVERTILDKPGRLDVEERSEVTKHSEYGHQLVRDLLSPSASRVVLNHHQRWDGSGYPAIPSGSDPARPPAGREIDPLSRIVTMADVFDAASTKRVYSRPKPAIRVLWEMLRQSASHFDPQVTRTFFSTVPAFPIGSQVRLSDGSTAAVIDFRPSHPCRPRVQVLASETGTPADDAGRHEIDLAGERDLCIASVAGTDVRAYYFECPFPLPETVDRVTGRAYDLRGASETRGADFHAGSPPAHRRASSEEAPNEEELRGK